MSETTIQYGGKTLKLLKSPNLVGVRPSHGRQGELVSTVARYGGTPARESLGGFQLIDLGAAPMPMEDALDAIREDNMVSVGTHVYHTSDDGVPFVPTGQIFLIFKDNSSKRDCQKLIEQHGLEILETRGENTLIVQTTSESSNPVKVAAALQQSPLVDTAEPDLATPAKMSAFVMPSDPLIPLQWHLQNSGELDGSTWGLKSGADARVLAAWQRAETLGSRDVIVAVIDDGFDLGHPDLAGAGKVVAPWDFTRNTDSPRPEFSDNYPQWNPDQQAWIGDWHGTACAGVAVGSAESTGIVGAAPDCRLMPIRWGRYLTDDQVEPWFDYIRTQGVGGG